MTRCGGDSKNNHPDPIPLATRGFFTYITSMKRVPAKKNKAFCIAPWSHTYISPQSERRLCCASREKAQFIKQYIDTGRDDQEQYQPLTLEKHWNSEFMRNIRKQMLQGEAPDECQVCNNQVLNLHTYKDYFNETLFPDLLEKAFHETDDTGATTMEPVSFDYRFSNLCNFKCRMCGPQLSSSWEAEAIKYKNEDGHLERWMQPDLRTKMKTFESEVVSKEFWQSIETQKIREIYWVGGEPLMWPIHWKAMHHLVESGHAKEVIVRYNTNLSIIERDKTNLFDHLLPHFKHYNICASLDAIGDIGEFIRTGLVWEQFKDNFEYARQNIANRDDNELVLDLTLTLPGLFGLKDYIEYANQQDVKIYTKIVFDFDPSKILSPFALPKDLLTRLLDDLIKEIQPITNQKNKSVLDTLKEMKNRPSFEEKYPDNYQSGLRKGKEFLLRLQNRRSDQKNISIEDILRKHSDIYSWWNCI